MKNKRTQTAFTLIFISFLLFLTYIYRENIIIFYMNTFTETNKNVKLEYKNEYFKNYNYKYVQTTDDFLINNKKEILNAYYTIINSGINEFNFFCSTEYEACIDDINEIANNQTIVSNINSFVHPYNSFNSVITKFDSTGKITLTVKKSYTDAQITAVNNKIDAIINEKLKDITDKKEIIKIIHDYIINNSKYDSDRSDRKISNYYSDIAYGPLIQGYGLCGGYADSMALFLNRYNIPNFKVLSENHVWNAVYIDNTWYHLDLTWDDPVVSDGTDTLEYSFFLISNDELEELNTNQHIFDKTVFQELQ